MADLHADDPDADLLPAAMAGDVDAFEALVLRYQRRVVGLSRTLTSVAEDAEDVAQEVFVRVYRALGSFRGESTFRTWLYRVAVNVVRTKRARRGRERVVWGDSGAEDAASFDPPDRRDFEAGLVTRDAIERALDALPEDLRVAVTLRDVHGLDYRDIAAATGAPLGTVESRIFRGRQRLRTLLAPVVAPIERGKQRP